MKDLGLKILFVLVCMAAFSTGLKAQFREEAFTLDELFAADEVIITSSSHLCRHADRIDGRDAGGKDPVLYERLRSYLLNEFFTATA